VNPKYVPAFGFAPWGAFAAVSEGVAADANNLDFIVLNGGQGNKNRSH